MVARGPALLEAATTSAILVALTRRYYKIRDLDDVTVETISGRPVARSRYVHGRSIDLLAMAGPLAEVSDILSVSAQVATDLGDDAVATLDVYVHAPAGEIPDTEELATTLGATLADADLPVAIGRVAFVIVGLGPHPSTETLTYRRPGPDGERPFWMAASTAVDEFEEDIKFRGMHPMIARRLHMWRLRNFEIRRLPALPDVFLFECVARTNPDDVRLVAVSEVRDLTPIYDEDGHIAALPEVEHLLAACLDGIRHAYAERSGRTRLEWNRVMLFVWPVVDIPLDDLDAVVRRLASHTEGLGIEQVVVQGRLNVGDGEPADVVMRLGYETGKGLTMRFTEPPTVPMEPLDDYNQKVIAARRRGMVYPYELIPLLIGEGGDFVEHDLDESGALVPIDRPWGGNRAGIVVGVASSPTTRYPEGVRRVVLLGDSSKAMGSIAEPECRRLLAAIELAASMGVPIEWFALSAGAKISMDSGSENLDWVARVLRRLVEHTQAGFEVNVVVAGVNVGAQPYWNAESTMLMHTSGILVMTPDSTMVLTGKQAIDYSGGVSAENNIGIGGYDRIMGPNGEAQYWAADLGAACAILRDHYELTYRAPGERWPRRATTADLVTRDVRTAPHRADGTEFTTVGEIFSTTANPDRKKPFDIRAVMRAVIDADREPLERWSEMAEAETAVVWESRLGGLAVTLVGMESRPLPRHGATPADGPASWSAGTLFPLSSKKVARAINAASGKRPVVVLANLSGFDGSPESLRRLQLEYGAEIGRAIVNFDGPIVLCVVSRYHGGAFVVFSATLNDSMEVLAVEGSFASVIGGAPAAAVVFTGEVNARTGADERVREANASVAGAGDDDERARLRAELASVTEAVRFEKLGEVAADFDRIHSVERAMQVGSVHRIIDAEALRPELIAAVERGMERRVDH